MQQQARRAVQFAQAVVDDRFPGARFESDYNTVGQDVVPRFSLYYQDVLTLIQAPATDSPTTWSLAISCGIAYELDDALAALEWANKNNREIGMGRYFCHIDQQNGKAALVLEHVIWGQLINVAFDGRDEDIRTSFMTRLVTELRSTILMTARDSQDVLNTQSGLSLTKNQVSLLALMRE